MKNWQRSSRRGGLWKIKKPWGGQEDKIDQKWGGEMVQEWSRVQVHTLDLKIMGFLEGGILRVGFKK